MEKGVPISQLLVGAFSSAKVRHRDLAETWIRISFRVGSRLPSSLLSVSIQREGELDLVIRCMEDELSEQMTLGKSDDHFVGHYLGVLSTYWIGGMYETFRLLRDRNLASDNERFSIVLRELELLRIPLEKHEIAKDRTLKEPLVLVRQPPKNDDSDKFTYSPNDELRSHIMPTGISARGSITWQVIDLKKNESRWVERRSLSDQILELWNEQ
jgi:hypothetical protein